MKLLTLFIAALLFVGCGCNLKDERKFKKEVFEGTIIKYDPPNHFSITWVLENGYSKRTLISKHCNNMKDGIIGMKIDIIKYTEIENPSNFVYVVNEEKSRFCGGN